MTEENVIEINKNSWHGRLTRYVFGYFHIQDTPSICPYFWSVVCAILVVPFYWVTQQMHWRMGVRVLVGLSVVWMFIGIGFAPELTLFIGLWLVGMFVVIQIVTWCVNAYLEKYPYVEKDEPTKPTKKPQESLLSAWLKARKDKVCPKIIEVRK